MFKRITALTLSALLFLGALLVPLSPVTVEAAFPGDNGHLAIVTSSQEQPGFTVRLVALDGEEYVLTDESQSDNSPNWSPDGSTLVFQHSSGGPPSLRTWVVGPSEPADLGVGGSQPSWSPDASQFIYHFGNLHTVNSDGTDSNDLGVEGISPQFSPDGQTILFVRYDTVEDSYSIYTVDDDGNNEVELTEGTHPNWSPDGMQIVFERDNAIYTMDNDGTNEIQIATGSFPAWSPDGQQVAFLQYGTGENHLSVMDTDGNNIENIKTYPNPGVEVSYISWGSNTSSLAEITEETSEETSEETEDLPETLVAAGPLTGLATVLLTLASPLVLAWGVKHVAVNRRKQ